MGARADIAAVKITSVGVSYGAYFHNIRIEGVAANGPTILLGDVDQNGVVNFLDFGPFIAVLSSGAFQAEADCDGSGTVDFLDISAFIEVLSGS